jgi:hypothetical protein
MTCVSKTCVLLKYRGSTQMEILHEITVYDLCGFDDDDEIEITVS